MGLPAGNFSSALLAQLQPSQNQDNFDQATFDFWTSKVRAPSENFAKGLISKGATDIPAFVYYDKDGFQLASSIDEKTLLDKGGTKVSFRVQGFRPSNTSTQSFNNLQSGSLRVDLKQTVPLPNLAEVLAWTAVAAFLPTTADKLPALKDLQFNPGESWGHLQEIPLTNGLGFWSWNFFLKKKESVWGKLMKAFQVANKAVFPVLGLPAIAVTALTAVDRIVGYFQAQDNSNWLFKSVESPVYATKEAKDKIGTGVALKTGNYLIIPQSQLSEFGKMKDSLEMKQGYLVKKGTGDFDVFDDAVKEIPAIDYISLAVKVDKAA
jgi:hypothetical protein